MKAKGGSLMLSVAAKNTQKTGAFSVAVAAAQSMGVYELSQNLVQARNTAWTVKQGKNVLGTVKLNGAGFAKNGVSYSLTAAKNQICLVLSLKAGKMLKATVRGGDVRATANSDVFANGTGNDTFRNGNGRDCAVYGKEKWGPDHEDGGHAGLGLQGPEGERHHVQPFRLNHDHREEGGREAEGRGRRLGFWPPFPRLRRHHEVLRRLGQGHVADGGTDECGLERSLEEGGPGRGIAPLRSAACRRDGPGLKRFGPSPWRVCSGVPTNDAFGALLELEGDVLAGLPSPFPVPAGLLLLLKGALPCPFQRIGSERQDVAIPANAPGGVRTALPCRHGATGFGQAPCGNAGTCQRTVFALTQAKDAFTRHGATAFRLFLIV